MTREKLLMCIDNKVKNTSLKQDGELHINIMHSKAWVCIFELRAVFFSGEVGTRTTIPLASIERVELSTYSITVFCSGDVIQEIGLYK